jgi:hypothetical protein
LGIQLTPNHREAFARGYDYCPRIADQPRRQETPDEQIRYLHPGRRFDSGTFCSPSQAAGKKQDCAHAALFQLSGKELQMKNISARTYKAYQAVSSRGCADRFGILADGVGRS